MQAIGSDGVPIPGASATSDVATGVFTTCVPGLEPVTMSFSLTGYPLTYYQETLGAIQQHEIGMLSNNVLSSLAPFVPGGLNQALGSILVFVSNGPTNCAKDGWSIDLVLADGGAVADGGAALIYMDPNSIPDPTLTATSGSGIAIFYNIETTQSNYFRVDASHSDAGSCVIQNGSLGYTGRLYVNGAAITYELFTL